MACTFLSHSVSFFLFFSSVQFSRSVTSNSLQPHGLQRARPPCPVTNSRSLLKLLSIKSVMASNRLILCHPLLLLPSIFANIRVFFFFFFFFIFYFLDCSGFCHTLKWNSHGFTCVLHPDPPSLLPLHPIPLGLPSAPGPSACLMHPTRVLFNESVHCIRWPKYWSFSFNISPSKEYSGLISFRMHGFDFFAVQGTLKSLLQHHSFYFYLLVKVWKC